jgi:hypothetical protein
MEIDDAVTQLKDHGLSLNITYHPSEEENEFSTALYEIVDGLHKASGNGISLSHGSGKDLPAVPALTFQHEGSGPINYMALPQGPEKTPFIEMLTAAVPGRADNGEVTRHDLRELDSPVDIVVFIASACPNCPQAVRAANQLAILSQKMTVTIVDVEVFPQLADHFKIRSVPMTVIDDELLISEVIPVQELAKKILSRQSAAYEKEAFLSQVMTGNIELATKRLLDGGQGEYFLASWRESTLSTRIALLITAKEAMEREPDILHGIVLGLIEELSAEDVSLKGDTIDLLGMIGHPDAIKPIESLLLDDNADIVEIAREALDNLHKKD